MTVDQPTKHQLDSNTWSIVTAADPSLAEPLPEPPKRTTQDIIAGIKNHLKERGFLTIRGVDQLFKNIDKNGNKKLEADEFFWGLNAFGITLSQQES